MWYDVDFVYLAAGLAPKSQDDQPAVRWVDIFEDGQGRGQLTAACSPIYAYNNTAGIPLFFGVICQGIKMHLAKTFDGWDSEWASIRNDQKKCNDLNLNFAQLQVRMRCLYVRVCMCVWHAGYDLYICTKAATLLVSITI